MNSNEIDQLQKQLLDLIPYWNYRISKPFKQLLDEGISADMYYCLRALHDSGGNMTMSELATWMQMTKQQMTKLANKLVELELADRVYDPADRRIIKLQITEKAQTYIDHFLKNNASCFRKMLENLDDKDCDNFKQALEIIMDIFLKLPT